MGDRDGGRFQSTNYGNPSTIHDFEAIHLRNKRLLHNEGECAGINCPYCEHEKFLKAELKTTKDSHP